MEVWRNRWVLMDLGNDEVGMNGEGIVDICRKE